MPYPNEHSCRLRDPGAFQDGSFRRSSREHEGKTYYIIMGKLKGETAMTEQAYRYPKDTWSVAQARAHCKAHKGILFEPAGGGAVVESRFQRCAAQHFGPWMVEPYWFMQAVAAVNSGAMQPETEMATDGNDGDGLVVDENGIVSIPIHGQMTKGESSFGGVSTVRTRQTIRRATRDEAIKGILLHIDSPGGTVAGTAELADDVARANEIKPVFAYIEDLGASAAYWVASQAGRLSANATAMIGSIGTLLVLEDTSGKAEQAGIRVHVVSTGPYKGAFADGVEISEEQLDYAQGLVDELNGHFLQGVKRGRDMPIGDARKLADGQLHVAAQAKGLNLIDAVETLDETVDKLRKLTNRKQGRSSREVAQLLRMAELEL